MDINRNKKKMFGNCTYKNTYLGKEYIFKRGRIMC